MRFDKVLIANRGEIAVRLINGCKKMGYKTVAVYSEADKGALHVQLADEAVAIGASPAKESYLVIEKIIAAAKISGACAIHPGYGFLSENALFAQAVQDAGLIFIGPDPESIAAMGNKSASKIKMLEAGVPCIPGYQGNDQSDAILLNEAQKIGFPVMVKAAAGGGGRGMRLVQSEADLLASIQSARSEALNAFGDAQLLIEKAVVNARHVEIQLFGDRHGNIVHFGERDCSIQRRNQKVVEEAPSPVVNTLLRTHMGAAAVAAAKAVNYVGAGTVEFMLTAQGEFYFLEMNTRLQVEHPVTELVYDVDLVEWQLRIAQGEQLPWTQEQILARAKGCAMEVRLCTEDPGQQFMPQTGTVLSWNAAEGSNQRVDHSLQTGQQITPFYDSMQAKLIAWGETREQARKKLMQLVEETRLLGVYSNRDLLAKILAHPEFASGHFSTSFIEDHFSNETLVNLNQPQLIHAALAAIVIYKNAASALYADAGLNHEFSDWQSSAQILIRMQLQVKNEKIQLQLIPRGCDEYTIQTDAGNCELAVSSHTAQEIRYVQHGLSCRASYAQDSNLLWLCCNGLTLCYTDMTLLPAEKKEAASNGEVIAPMDGKIMTIFVQPGELVQKGQKLATLEAMKMEFSILSSMDGKIDQIQCHEGLQVKVRQLLFHIQAL